MGVDTCSVVGISLGDTFRRIYDKNHEKRKNALRAWRIDYCAGYLDTCKNVVMMDEKTTDTSGPMMLALSTDMLVCGAFEQLEIANSDFWNAVSIRYQFAGAVQRQ